MRKLFRLLRYDWPVHFVLLLTNWLPDNVPSLRLRGALVVPFMGSCGHNLRVGRNVSFYNPGMIHLGSDVYIGYGCWFMAGERIEVGDEVLFGPYCVLSAGKHTRLDMSFRFGEHVFAPIVVGEGTWIGGHVTIAGGVRIGKGCLVGSNAVVTSGQIPDDSFVVGVPARVREKLVGGSSHGRSTCIGDN